MSNLRAGLALVLGLCLVCAAGCRPKYPKCDNDSHCKPGEHCVQGRCQQCRDNSDCPSGQRCEKGACVTVPCKSDAECGQGMICRDGQCAVGCRSTNDCPEGQECQGGQCVAPPQASTDAPCTPDTVYFDFNESILTTEAVAALARGQECIKRVGQRPLRVEGHCDPRGTEEYNLALGDRRARSVMKHLGRLGTPQKSLRPVSKGKIEAQGSDERGWARDRKVQFVWE